MIIVEDQFVQGSHLEEHALENLRLGLSSLPTVLFCLKFLKF